MISVASVCLFVCLFVRLFVNTITSERANIGWWNLASRCTVQKYRPSSNLGVIAPTWVRTAKNVALGYDVGKISADCLVLIRFLHLSTRERSAPVRRARNTVHFLEQSTPAFIPPDMWPPNSTDLNAVDYKIWGDIQQQVHQSRIEEAFGGRLAWHGPERHWRCNWRVASASLSVCAGNRRTFHAAVANLTIALSAEPCDFVSSNMTCVICLKFELQFSTVV